MPFCRIDLRWVSILGRMASFIEECEKEEVREGAREVASKNEKLEPCEPGLAWPRG